MNKPIASSTYPFLQSHSGHFASWYRPRVIGTLPSNLFERHLISLPTLAPIHNAKQFLLTIGELVIQSDIMAITIGHVPKETSF